MAGYRDQSKISQSEALRLKFRSCLLDDNERDLSAIAKFLVAVCNGRFLPRDAMHKRGLCRHPVSVCLCVCHVRELCQNE